MNKKKKIHKVFNALSVSFHLSSLLALLGLPSPTSFRVFLPARGGQTHDQLIFRTYAAAVWRLSHRRLRLCRLRLCQPSSAGQHKQEDRQAGGGGTSTRAEERAGGREG